MFQTSSFLLPLLLFTRLPSVTGLTVAAVIQNIEATPLVIALEDHYNASSYTFIPTLLDLGVNPDIDLYAGAEVHVLGDAPHHPDLRVIATVVQFSYRIVADKSKGILTPSDLRGKRIGVVGNVTSEYFAYRYLTDVVGLNSSEYTLVRSGGLCYALPCGNGTYPQMLATGQIDAFTAFEPTTTVGAMALGEENAIFFRNDTVYRKVNVLYTSQAKLDNATTRAEIVGYLRALGKTHEVFTNEPEKVWPRVARITTRRNGNGTVVNGNGTVANWNGTVANVATEEVMRRFWPMARWNMGIPEDLVDLMVKEDRWVAEIEGKGRVPISREGVEGLIDTEVLREAMEE